MPVPRERSVAEMRRTDERNTVTTLASEQDSGGLAGPLPAACGWSLGLVEGATKVLTLKGYYSVPFGEGYARKDTARVTFEPLP